MTERKGKDGKRLNVVNTLILKKSYNVNSMSYSVMMIDQIIFNEVFKGICSKFTQMLFLCDDLST